MSWWRHQMETISMLLAICVGNSPVTGEFPAQRPVTLNVDVFLDLRLNKRLVNTGEAGDLRRHRAHYDVTVMTTCLMAAARRTTDFSFCSLYLLVVLRFVCCIFRNVNNVICSQLMRYVDILIDIFFVCFSGCTIKTDYLWQSCKQRGGYAG